MKFFNAVLFSLLIALSAQNIKAMNPSLVMAGLSQAPLLYDAATALVAVTGAYFGYEVAAKYLKKTNQNTDNSGENTTSHSRYGTIQSLREALHSLKSETENIELFKETLTQGF